MPSVFLKCSRLDVANPVGLTQAVVRRRAQARHLEFCFFCAKASAHSTGTMITPLGAKRGSGTSAAEPNPPPKGRRFCFRVKVWVKEMQAGCRAFRLPGIAWPDPSQRRREQNLRRSAGCRRPRWPDRLSHYQTPATRPKKPTTTTNPPTSATNPMRGGTCLMRPVRTIGQWRLSAERGC